MRAALNVPKALTNPPPAYALRPVCVAWVWIKWRGKEYTVPYAVKSYKDWRMRVDAPDVDSVLFPVAYYAAGSVRVSPAGTGSMPYGSDYVLNDGRGRHMGDWP